MWPFSTMVRDRDKPETRDNGFTAFLDLTTPVAAGVSVTQDNAVNLPAVYKCVSLNAETISSLPVDVYAKRGKARVPYQTPPFVTTPNPFQNFAEFIAMSQTSLDLAGNCYWLKATDGSRVVGLSVIAPSAVEPKVTDGQLVYWVTTNGGREPFAATEIVHMRGLTLPGQLVGLSPIECAKQTIGIGLAAEQYGGQFFGTGATLSGIIASPGSMTQEQADRIKEAFTKKHGGVSKSHAIGVLSGGATWTPLSVKPEEAQFLETRQYTNDEVAQMFGYPPGFFDSDGAKGYVTALHASLRFWYVRGLLPRITRLETALSSCLPRPAYVKFNTHALLRLDPAQQTAFFAAGQTGEYLTRNEIRAWLEMDPVEGGDEFLHSVQWQENAPPDGGDTDDPPEPASAGSPVKEPEE